MLIQRDLNPSNILSWLCASLVFIPLLALVAEAFLIGDAYASLDDIPSNVLLTYIANSIGVTLIAVVTALMVAVLPAWWCSRYEFKGRIFLTILMVLPLAIPAYINGYILTEWLDFAGPIQTTLREWFGWQSAQDYWVLDIRNVWGAGVVLGLALYPYLFLLAYNAFRQLPESLASAAATLGASSSRIFWLVQLPMIRPAIAVGCTLVAMEALADFGTVQLFAVSTLTTAVYDTWLVYGSLASAAKIAVLTLIIVLMIVVFERYSRRRQQFFAAKSYQGKSRRTEASVMLQTSIWVSCLIVIAIGFVLPVIHLIHYLIDYWQQNIESEQWQYLLQTLELAGMATVITIIMALLVNFSLRTKPSLQSRCLVNISSLGYAVPGTVLAIGVLIPLTELDKWVNRWYHSLTDERLGLLFSGSIFALVLAYSIRFAVISIGQVSSAYQQMPTNIDEAAMTLGASRWRTWTQIQLPMLKPALLSAFVLVFIECIKELPASLLLRPFDFETLATYVYQHASDEQLEIGALSALMIIILSLIPVIFVSKKMEQL
ncbi:iron ABC transporter permease [Shewanella sp. OPT22]|nr:iron ABC transporter permease [Shewanella sp. OPT22]